MQAYLDTQEWQSTNLDQNIPYRLLADGTY